jgi:hypothetical protein
VIFKLFLLKNAAAPYTNAYISMGRTYGFSDERQNKAE